MIGKWITWLSTWFLRPRISVVLSYSISDRDIFHESNPKWPVFLQAFKSFKIPMVGFWKRFTQIPRSGQETWQNVWPANTILRIHTQSFYKYKYTYMYICKYKHKYVYLFQITTCHTYMYIIYIIYTWTFKGAPSLNPKRSKPCNGTIWHPLEGAGIYIYT